MGLPNPQFPVSVIDTDGNPCKPGEHGQLVIHTEAGKPLGLFKEYHRQKSLTEKSYNNGIYYTKDVVYYDEDGYFWFVSRSDDVIKSSGYRIGPFEVENALMTHPAIVECAITGAPDEVRGMVVKATIVLSDAYKGKEGPELIKELQMDLKHITMKVLVKI